MVYINNVWIDLGYLYLSFDFKIVIREVIVSIVVFLLKYFFNLRILIVSFV